MQYNYQSSLDISATSAARSSRRPMSTQLHFNAFNSSTTIPLIAIVRPRTGACITSYGILCFLRRIFLGLADLQVLRRPHHSAYVCAWRLANPLATQFWVPTPPSLSHRPSPNTFSFWSCTTRPRTSSIANRRVPG